MECVMSGEGTVKRTTLILDSECGLCVANWVVSLFQNGKQKEPQRRADGHHTTGRRQCKLEEEKRKKKNPPAINTKEEEEEHKLPVACYDWLTRSFICVRSYKYYSARHRF